MQYQSAIKFLKSRSFLKFLSTKVITVLSASQKTIYLKHYSQVFELFFRRVGADTCTCYLYSTYNNICCFPVLYFPVFFISPVNVTRFSLRIYLHSQFSLEILGVGVASCYKCRMNLCLSSCSSPPRVVG